MVLGNKNYCGKRLEGVFRKQVSFCSFFNCCSGWLMHKLILHVCGLDMHGLLWICFVFRPWLVLLLCLRHKMLQGLYYNNCNRSFSFNDVIRDDPSFSIGIYNYLLLQVKADSVPHFRIEQRPIYQHKLPRFFPQ